MSLPVMPCASQSAERLRDDGVDLLVRHLVLGRNGVGDRDAAAQPEAERACHQCGRPPRGVSTRMGTAIPLEREKNDGNSSVP